MALPRVNVVVIGAGAGGGIVVKELAVAGLSVVLLERGAGTRPSITGRTICVNQRTTGLGNAFGPDDDRTRACWWTATAASGCVYPPQGGYSNNAACVGGGTVSYGAMAWRFMEKDFRMRSTYGALEGSTLDDWPISYDDLEPYYEKAEWEIGVSGDDEHEPLQGAAPQAAADAAVPPATASTRSSRPAAQRLGLHPFDIPMLRNTVPYDGRAGLHALPLVRRASPARSTPSAAPTTP